MRGHFASGNANFIPDRSNASESSCHQHLDLRFHLVAIINSSTATPVLPSLQKNRTIKVVHYVVHFARLSSLDVRVAQLLASLDSETRSWGVVSPKQFAVLGEN